MYQVNQTTLRARHLILNIVAKKTWISKQRHTNRVTQNSIQAHMAPIWQTHVVGFQKQVHNDRFEHHRIAKSSLSQNSEQTWSNTKFSMTSDIGSLAWESRRVMMINQHIAALYECLQSESLMKTWLQLVCSQIEFLKNKRPVGMVPNC